MTKPHPNLSDFYSSETDRRAHLNETFDATAAHYDSINSIMSLRSDRRYRRSALNRSRLAEGMAVLDVGCGTGLTAIFAKEIVGPGGLVVGVDPSDKMRQEAIKNDRIDEGLNGIAEKLPVESGSFDMVTMTFALRHVADLSAAFQEFNRVLKPGGTVLLLEMTTPSSGWKLGLLKLWVKHIVPNLAMLCARRQTARWLYQYCWESHEQCVRPEVITKTLREVGFHQPKRNVQIGIFSEYTAQKV